MIEHKRNKHYSCTLIKALGITALAFALSFMFMAPFTASTAAFFSTPEKNDFTITDFYNIVADSRAVSHLDDNVVIVNIDNSGRPDIADILQIVSLAGARAVGLDVMFEDPREGDEVLLDAIRVSPNLIMPVSMRLADRPGLFRLDNTQTYFAPEHYADSLHLAVDYAASSMPSKYEGTMIREMQVFFPLASGDTILSVPAALVQMADPDAYRTLRARGNMLEYINFHSRRFTVLEPESLLDNADMLTGRIVLIGAIHELGDLHPTPVNSAMPGVLIHAHCIATALDGAYMRALPKWCNVLIGFLLCFIVVLTHVSLNNGAKALVLRLLQVALLWIIVQIGYWLFISHSIIVDFSYALLMLAFGLFASDIWVGVTVLAQKTRERYHAQKIKHINTPTEV